MYTEKSSKQSIIYDSDLRNPVQRESFTVRYLEM